MSREVTNWCPGMIGKIFKEEYDPVEQRERSRLFLTIEISERKTQKQDEVWIFIWLA